MSSKVPLSKDYWDNLKSIVIQENNFLDKIAAQNSAWKT